MNLMFRRLTCLLLMTALLVSFALLWAPGLVHAATCTPQATLAADIPPNGPLDTGANVIATFNTARQQEGCNVSLSIDPAVYDAATPQVQELMLVNAERQDRGLPPLQLDTTLLSQIDLNHSSEMVQYNYFAHSSPINQPGGQNDPQARLTINPAINGHWDGWAGNIAGGGTADTQPPTLNPPTIVDANTVQVTNVHDESDGNTTGATGVTGVVFYVGSAVDQSGNFLTVVAKQGPATPGTWTATLAATDLSTLHAVAVDGSGNYNDCVGNANSC